MKAVVERVVKAVVERGREKHGQDVAVRLFVAVAPDADRGAVAALRSALRPETAEARVGVATLGACAGGGVPAGALGDAALVLAGSSVADACAAHGSFVRCGVPCCVVVPVPAGRETLADLVEGGVPVRDVVACGSETLAGAVGAWLVGILPDRGPALSAGFACCRRARARALAAEAAGGNALVGAVPFGDAADFPAMWAAEVTMMLGMADAYGLPLQDRARLGEAAVLACFALALCGVARVCEDRMPLPAFAVRAGVAGGGTYLAGLALMRRYEALAAQDDRQQTEEGTVLA